MAPGEPAARRVFHARCYNESMGEQPKCRSVILRVVVAMFCAVLCYCGAILATLVLRDGVLIVEPEPPPSPVTKYNAELAYAAFEADQKPRLRECVDHCAQQDFAQRLDAQHTIPIVSILGMIAGC
jgi:hypothetical protein